MRRPILDSATPVGLHLDQYGDDGPGRPMGRCGASLRLGVVTGRIMNARTIFFEGAYFEAPRGVSVEEWLTLVKADPRSDEGMNSWAARLATAFEEAGVK